MVKQQSSAKYAKPAEQQMLAVSDKRYVLLESII